MIDCSSWLESDLLGHDKQVGDVKRIAAEEGEDVYTRIQLKGLLLLQGVWFSDLCVLPVCTLIQRIIFRQDFEVHL